MARTGLTNFVVWALATLLLGFVLFAGQSLLFVVGIAALAIAWLTRFWPEGLGVTAGIFPLLLMERAALAAVCIAMAGVVVWRLRADSAVPTPSAPSAASTSRRLTVATLVSSFAIFLFDGFLVLVFGFTCQSDTSHATPGSDRAAWCDALGKHDLALPVLLGPPALVFLIGIYAASRGRAREVMITAIAGFALVIALHVPDFALSNAGP